MGFYSALLKQGSTRILSPQEVFTSSDIAQRVELTCRTLTDLGVRSGQMMTICHHNSPWHAILFLACERMNLVFVPLYEGLTSFEHSQILEELHPHWTAVFHEGALDVRPWAPSSPPLEQSGILFRTSGTTGTAGFVLQTFASLLHNAELAAQGQHIDSTSDVLTTLPLSHVGGFSMQTTAALLVGARIHLVPPRAVDAFIEKLQMASHTIVVPSYLKILEGHHEFASAHYAHHPLVITGSTRVSLQTFSALQDKGFRVQSAYGLTEMGPYACVFKGPTRAQEVALSPLGNPVQGYDIRLSANGEIRIKGPCSGLSFSPLDRSLRKLTNEDGYLATGDLGELRGDEIYFSGRSKQIIVVGGLKVNASEIENQILLFPKVQRCLVLARQHYLLGEVPVAYVVGEGVDKSVLRRFLSERLGRHRLPREIHFVQNLPQTSIGKNDLARAQRLLESDVPL